MEKRSIGLTEKSRNDPGFRRGRIISAITLVSVFVVIIWLGKGLVITPQPQTIIVYCFIGMQEVMVNGIFPAFQDYWNKLSKEKVEFIPTFAGSGAIVHQIVSNFPAEVAILSSRIDAVRLSEQIVIPVKSWQDLPNSGVFCGTPIILITRDRNPKEIECFSDFLKPGIEIVQPDPLTSGAGEWTLLAMYSTFLGEGLNNIEATQRVGVAWENVVDKPANAQEALRQFISGTGDVLATYESNLLGNPWRNQIPGQLTYPHSTIMCEHIVVPIVKNINPKQKEIIDAFVQFLWCDEGQQILKNFGYSTVSTIRQGHQRIQEPIYLDSLGDPREIRLNIVETLLRDVILPSSGNE